MSSKDCKATTLEVIRVAFADSLPSLSTALIYKLNGGLSALTTTLFDFLLGTCTNGEVLNHAVLPEPIEYLIS